MSARATRWLLFTALLLFAPTLAGALGFFGTVPVGVWLVSAAGALRGRLHRSDVTTWLIVGVQVLAWAWAWWFVAGRLAGRIRRALPERQGRLMLAIVILIAAVGVLPIYGWAAQAGLPRRASRSLPTAPRSRSWGPRGR